MLDVGSWTFDVQLFSFWSYVCESSPDMVNWLPVSTNFNSSGTLRLQLPQAGVHNFYRAHILR